MINSVASILSALTARSSFSWLLCPCDIPHHCVYILLALPNLGTTKYSRIILHIPQPYNQPFVQKVLVPFFGEWYQKQDPGAGYVCCYWSVTDSRSSQLREQESGVRVYMHIYTCAYIYYKYRYQRMYIHVYKYMHAHTCVYMFTRVYTHLSIFLHASIYIYIWLNINSH